MRRIAVTTTKSLPDRVPKPPGGALDYVVNGKMIGGFGLVAYGSVSQLRRDDLHCQSRGHGVPKRPWTGHRRDRREDKVIRSRPELEKSRRDRAGEMSAKAATVGKRLSAVLNRSEERFDNVGA
jgi:Protein of unknown function (DUF2950)